MTLGKKDTGERFFRFDQDAKLPVCRLHGTECPGKQVFSDGTVAITLHGHSFVEPDELYCEAFCPYCYVARQRVR